MERRMADRKLAADARRVVNGSDTREQTQTLRKILKENFERGRKQGRAEVESERASADPRNVLLQGAADTLDMHASRVSSIPNSSRATAAFTEAAGILRDAAALGESPPDPPEEPEPKSKAKAKTG